MSDPFWFFPNLNNGEESGLNESGIEVFKPPESLARETVQNILDHPDDSGRPCIAEFEYLDLPASEFPGREYFTRVFRSCKQHVLRDLPDGAGNERNFFDEGLRILGGATIPTLRIGDKNTTGLVGGDDERGKPFWRLIRGQGYSSQEGMGGGTYGIGQRAPFAASALRTIIYSTRLATGDEAFVAKAILASHPNPDTGELTQSKGWWCLPPAGNGWHAIRDPARIPARFRRGEPGTDLYVLGYKVRDWIEVTRRAVLQNFFAAIDYGLLQVRLINNGTLLDEITKENLEEKLLAAAEQARSNPSEYKRGLGTTLYYLRALHNPYGGAPFTRNIPGLGTVKLFVHRDTHDPDVPERWTCMRKPLWVVEDHGSSLLSRFAAVLVCDSEEANKILARMEDPRHSRWHEEEMRNPTESERRQARDARLALKRFVTDTLRSLRESTSEKEQDIPLLGRFLPMETDPDEEPANGAATEPSGGATQDETGHRTTKSATGSVKGSARKTKPPRIRVKTIGAGGGGLSNGGDGGGSGGGSRVGSGGDVGGGDSGCKPGGQGKGEDPGVTGAGPQAKVLTSTDVTFRGYFVNGAYHVVLHADSDVTGDLVLEAVGEDNSTNPVVLITAMDSDTGENLQVHASRVVGVKVQGGRPRHLAIVMTPGEKVCLQLGG